jgi:hypothetical protein
MLSSPSHLSCSHHLLAASFFMDFPLYPEQNIYLNIALLKSLWNYLSNVWSFIENGVQTRELCPFYFSVAFCPKLISGRVALGDSGITACRNLRLSWFLICWKCNFMGLLNIQKYTVFSLREHAEFWWDRWLLAYWSGDVNDLDHFYLLECRVALLCWRFRVSPMLSILLVMEEEDKIFLSYSSFNFLVVRVFILPARRFKRTFYPQGDGWE